MQGDFDWVAALATDFIESPALRAIVAESDHVFLQQHTTNGPESFARLRLELLSTTSGYVRAWLAAQSAILQRELIFSLDRGEPLAACFVAFQHLLTTGFTSPVEKAAIVMALVTRLRNRKDTCDVDGLLKEMALQLEECIAGCTACLEEIRVFKNKGGSE